MNKLKRNAVNSVTPLGGIMYMSWVSANGKDFEEKHQPLTCRDGFLAIVAYSIFYQLAGLDGYRYSTSALLKFNLGRKSRIPMALLVEKPEILKHRILLVVNKLEDHLGFKRTLVEMVQDYHPYSNSQDQKRLILRIDPKWLRDQPTSSFYFMLVRTLVTNSMTDYSVNRIVEKVASCISSIESVRKMVKSFILNWNELHDMSVEPIRAYLGFDYKGYKWDKYPASNKVTTGGDNSAFNQAYGFGIQSLCYLTDKPLPSSRITGRELITKFVDLINRQGGAK